MNDENAPKLPDFKSSHVILGITEVLGRCIQAAFKWVTVIVVSYLFFSTVENCVRISAGETTSIAFLLGFIGYGPISLTIGVVISAGSITIAWNERKAKEKKTKYLQDRIIELEKKIDPSRSTSGLTPEGRTNPEDKI